MAKVGFERGPKHVTTIPKVHNFKKISSAVHAFNSLVLDAKLRWYSEEMSRDYFTSKKDFDNYMHTIDNNAMDFTTIKKKIHQNKYKNNNMLFNDMELVFNNAMKANTKGDIWYDEAKRLNKILLYLTQQKKIHCVTWIPYNINTRLCPECNNIMLHKTIKTPLKCHKCKCINYLSCYSYICHNHSNSTHSYCLNCVQKYCIKCHNWCLGTHNSNKCSYKHGYYEFTKYFSYGLTTLNSALNIEIPMKPNNVKTVNKFENIKLTNNNMFLSKMKTIIKHFRTYDTKGTFFKPVKNKHYNSFINNPIHFDDILNKINEKKYKIMGEIQKDIDLIWRNCYLFNGYPDIIHPRCSEISNFAAALEWTLNQYIEQFSSLLIEKKWINTNMSDSCEMSLIVDITALITPPCDGKGCDNMSVLWKSLNSFSNDVMKVTSNYALKRKLKIREQKLERKIKKIEKQLRELEPPQKRRKLS
eukprot:521684_1